MVLAKCGKNSNVHAVGSAVTTILKKLSQLSGKSCDNYPETTVTAVIRQLFALGRNKWDQLSDFRLLERTFSIYGMELAKNGKIFFKGILLFWE